MLEHASVSRTDPWGQILDEIYEPAGAGLGERIVALGPECVPLAASVRRRRAGSLTGAGDTLYLATPATATAARLRALDSEAAPSSGNWGVVAGADATGVEFALAKLQATPRPAPVQWAAVDGIHRRLVIDGDECAWSHEHIVAALTRARLLVLVAHGEGAHANLGGVVVCGVVGDRERVAGRPITGGCIAGRRCKRARPGVVVIPARSIRATEAVLVSCNSFLVAPELYPSNSSLLLALIDGHARTVVGSRAPVDVGPGTLDHVLETLAESPTWAAVVGRLNDGGTPPGPFAVHGRPSERPPRLRPARPAPPSPRAWPAERAALEAAARRVESAGLLEAGFAATLRDAGGVEPAAEALRTMSRARTRATLRLQAAWSGLARDPLARPSPPTQLSHELAGDARAWTEAVHGLVAAQQTGVDLSAALGYGRRPVRRAPHGPCPRCHTTTDVVVLGAMSAGAALRRLWCCPVCGVLDGWAGGGLRCHLTVPPMLAGAAELTFRLRISGADRSRPPWRPDAPVPVAVTVKDKARGVTVWRSTLTLEAARPWVTVTTGHRAADFAPDLHTVSALAVGPFSIAAARRRFARGEVVR